MGNRGKKYSAETNAQQLVEAVDSKVKINTKEIFFNMLFPPIIPMEDLRNVHPWVKSLFSARKVPNLPLAERLKHFLEAWEILTKDSEILGIVKGLKIPFLKHSTQERVFQTPYMSQEQADLIRVGIENMLKKGVIQQTASGWGVFKQYFLGWEKRWGKSTCDKLKILRPVHSIPAFQNGRFVLPPRITARGRLHVQAGYERCLFFSSTASAIKELCLVFMVRES